MFLRREEARGLVTKHAVKQVDRLLSNEGIDVWDNHPASGQYDEAFGLVRALHDLHLPFAQVAHGGNEVLAGVTAIGGHMAQPGIKSRDRSQQRLGAGSNGRADDRRVGYRRGRWG